jgi:pectin methylesterase-like acyl-CoA thioesterase
MTTEVNSRFSRLIPLLLYVIFLCPYVFGMVIYVDDDGLADFNTIQAAIDDANDGDTVVVAPGTYNGGGNRDIDFKGKAIIVQSIDPNDPNIVASTIINCQQQGRGLHFQGALHVCR